MKRVPEARDRGKETVAVSPYLGVDNSNEMQMHIYHIFILFTSNVREGGALQETRHNILLGADVP